MYEKTKFKVQDAETSKNFEVVFHPVKIETVSFLGGIRAWLVFLIFLKCFCVFSDRKSRSIS